MTITLQVAQLFDSYRIGDQIVLPDTAALALLKAFPGRYQFGSSSGVTPGSPVVVPSLPNGVIAVLGAPDPTLAATYGYALDLTSAPATLYHWIGTVWTVVLQAGAGGSTPAPALAALNLSSTASVVGTPFSAAISGRATGSNLAATSSDGTVLTIVGATLSGTFAAAGQPTVTLTETLAGATGSPKSTQVTVAVTAATPDTTITTDLSNPDRGLNPLI